MEDFNMTLLINKPVLIKKHSKVLYSTNQEHFKKNSPILVNYKSILCCFPNLGF